ncbi:MAG: metallophosphoesterase [Armatimonadota bacterium]
MIFFLGIVISLFALINYYIGMRGWQVFGPLLHGWTGVVYWVVFILLASSYLVGRFGEIYLPSSVSNVITVIGSYWLGAMIYFFLTLVLIDVVRLFDRFLHFIPQSVLQRPDIIGMAIVLLVGGVMMYGIWNAQHPQLRHYDVTIDKPAGTLRELHLVVASDIHLGTIVHRQRLAGLVERINALKPDLVILPGDTIDENVNPFIQQQMPALLRQIQATYGTYAVFGNHEYIGGQSEEAFRALEDSGVTVLRDDMRKIDGRFYLVGRDDRSRTRFVGTPRKSLAEIMTGVNRSLPIILLDHQPFRLEEGVQQGADLQISGHTHHGQIFPNNLITKKIYENDWGYLRKGNYQSIVSCGFGTWGPPLRIGSTPEIVDIVIHFKPD